jgi:hypothetical protein
MPRESKVADSDLNFVLADWLIDDVDEGGFEKSRPPATAVVASCHRIKTVP